MLLGRQKRPLAPSRFPLLHSWCIPAALLITGVAAIVGVHTGWISLSPNPSWDFLTILAVTEVSVIAWIVFLSQLRTDRRLLVMLVFVGLQAGLHKLVRLDGFTGDRRPIWTFVWQPSPRSIDWERREVLATTPTVDLTPSPSDYPAFRGRDRAGHVPHITLNADWKNAPPRLLWKQPIGQGWSSFAVVGNYCITQEQRGQRETTVCYELQTGRECWAHHEQVLFYEVTSGEGPRATPSIHNGRVYSLGATGILNCLDGATGESIWKVNILADNDAPNLLFGVTGSPLIAGSFVIVNPGGRGSSLAAYDLEKGRRVWRNGTAGASYSSPQLARIGGIEQVLDFNADGLFAHELHSGRVLWSIPWISNPAERNNVCQPVALPADAEGEPDCVFIASGYGMGCAIFELHPRGESFEVVERWQNRNLKAKFSSVVVHDGCVFGLDEAILTCVKLSTGERCWKGGRYGYGQLLLAGSQLLVQLESGEIALVEASPAAFHERARFAALSDRTWNHPALAGRYLVVRNDREAACFELPLK